MTATVTAPRISERLYISDNMHDLKVNINVSAVLYNATAIYFIMTSVFYGMGKLEGSTYLMSSFGALACRVALGFIARNQRADLCETIDKSHMASKERLKTQVLGNHSTFGAFHKFVSLK